MKRIVLVCVLATLLMLAFAQPAPAEPAPYGPVTLHFYGKVGTYPVEMELTIDDGKATGVYWYEAYSTDIELEGTYHNQTVVLNEKDADGNVAARLAGSLNPLSGQWVGTWTSADGKRALAFDLKLAAEIVKTTEKRLGHIDVQVVRPVLVDALAAAADDPAQRFIDEAAFSPVDDMVRDDLNEAVFEPEEYWFSHVVATSYQIRYFSDDLLSIMGTVYTFLGGAHGMTNAAPLNLVRYGDEVRTVALTDVMRAGSGWEKKLNSYIMSNLKKQGAAWVLNGDVKSVPVEQLQRFTLTPAGIEFYFDAYEMGPYSDGMYSVKVPWIELKGMVNLDGPVGSIASGARA
jgi:hypothetical protein